MEDHLNRVGKVWLYLWQIHDMVGSYLAGCFRSYALSDKASLTSGFLLGEVTGREFLVWLAASRVYPSKRFVKLKIHSTRCSV